MTARTAARPNLIAAVLMAATVAAACPSSAPAAKRTLVQTERELDSKREKEQILSTDINSYTLKMRELAGPLRAAQARFKVVQNQFESELATLQSVQERLRLERELQAKLARKLERGRRIVARRLVALYKSGGKADLVAVVLRARTFGEFIESQEFVQRVSAQDVELITELTAAKRESDRLAKLIAAQERQHQRLTAQIKAHRDEINRTRLPLLQRQQQFSALRSAKTAMLEATRESIDELERDASKLRADEAAISGTLQRSGSIVAMTGKSGTASLIWPVNGPVTSPYDPSVLNGTAGFHPGVDIGAPEGTPIRAAADGVVALMQTTGESGGFGIFTCIQHTS